MALSVHVEYRASLFAAAVKRQTKSRLNGQAAIFREPLVNLRDPKVRNEEGLSLLHECNLHRTEYTRRYTAVRSVALKAQRSAARGHCTIGCAAKSRVATYRCNAVIRRRQ